MDWFRTIARTGIKNSHEYQVRRGILISNYISLILMGALTVLFIVRRTYFANLPGGISLSAYITGMVVFATPILSNKAGFTSMSRIILCYAPVLVIWTISIKVMLNLPAVVQATYDSVRILFLSTCFIPYMLLDSKKPVLLLSGILPTLFSLLLFNDMLSLFGLGMEQQGIGGTESVLIGSRTFVAYFIISLSCLIFRSIVTYNDELNKIILSQLKIKTQEIISQNNELVSRQNELNELNAHLEELVLKKTEDIRKQNERLLKYAYANAHHVRGPVARLLGLIELSKLDPDLGYPWFFEKVEHESRAVDSIIRTIARELDEIDVKSNEAESKLDSQ